MPAIIVDPELLAAVTRQFQLRGELQPFNLTENVVPTFDIGRILALDPAIPQQVVSPGQNNSVQIGLASGRTVIPTVTPRFMATDVVPDTQAAVAAGTVLADSGQLAAGDFWVDCSISQNDGTTVDLALQWRNAADAANILQIPFFGGLRVGKLFHFRDVALDERFRLVTNTAIAGTIHSYMATALTNTPQAS